MKTKPCSGCGEEKPLYEFVIDRRRADGYASVCRSCFSERILATKRGDGGLRFEPEMWHLGCKLCNPNAGPATWYQGPKCKHPDAIEGRALMLGGDRMRIYPEGHPEFVRP
jgi:hypothetical protein